MQSLMILVQDEARAIRSLQEKVPKLKEQRSEAKGIFKGKERKALTEQIQQTEQEIDRRLDKLPDILKGGRLSRYAGVYGNLPRSRSRCGAVQPQSCRVGATGQGKAQTAEAARKRERPKQAQTATGARQTAKATKEIL